MLSVENDKITMIILNVIFTSTGANNAFSPNSSATVLPFETGKSAITAFAPCLINRSTVPRPNPEAPPVTKATTPCKKKPDLHQYSNEVIIQQLQYID